MSRENVEIARQAWTAFTEGGVQATLPYYAEECICEDMPELPDGGSIKGGEGCSKETATGATCGGTWC
jgi:hypothetical protein